MPWSPSWQRPVDTRLDAYRNRVAALTRDGDGVGHVLILTEHVSEQLGGHLWWRRWTPDRELPIPYVQMVDGSVYDQPVFHEDLEAELEHWGRGEFPLLGELLGMQWLSLDDALKVAPKVFGVSSCLGKDGEVTWSFDNEE